MLAEAITTPHPFLFIGTVLIGVPLGMVIGIHFERDRIIKLWHSYPLRFKDWMLTELKNRKLI